MITEVKDTADLALLLALTAGGRADRSAAAAAESAAAAAAESAAAAAESAAAASDYRAAIAGLVGQGNLSIIDDGNGNATLGVSD